MFNKLVNKYIRLYNESPTEAPIKKPAPTAPTKPGPKTSPGPVIRPKPGRRSKPLGFFGDKDGENEENRFVKAAELRAERIRARRQKH